MNKLFNFHDPITVSVQHVKHLFEVINLQTDPRELSHRLGTVLEHGKLLPAHPGTPISVRKLKYGPQHSELQLQSPPPMLHRHGLVLLGRGAHTLDDDTHGHVQQPEASQKLEQNEERGHIHLAAIPTINYRSNNHLRPALHGDHLVQREHAASHRAEIRFAGRRPVRKCTTIMTNLERQENCKHKCAQEHHHQNPKQSAETHHEPLTQKPKLVKQM
mmetsp:Transcript_83603/g.190787  ORF Transcript_83603/g.190787 Transcript_83603/m.190787 type:complete len:217 (-) Transcript_83603:472-1122(-)